MYNKIKFATGLVVIVVMTAAIFGLSLKSRHTDSQKSMNNYAVTNYSNVKVSTAVAKERVEYGPDTNPIPEVEDDNFYAALAIGVTSDSNEPAKAETPDFMNVRQVKIDDDRVLLATAGGVVEFCPADSSFMIYSNSQGLKDHDCYALLKVGTEIYVGTSGGVYLIEANGRASRIWPEIYDTVTVLKLIGNDYLVGTRNCGLYLSSWDVIDQISSAKGIIDATLNSSGLWILTSDKGLLCDDGNGWKHRYLKNDTTALAAANCLISAYGQPWLGSAKGVYFFNGGAWTLIDSTDGLFEQNVTALAKGKTFVYIGTAKGGVFSYYDGALSPLDWSEGLDVSALDVVNGSYLVGLQRGGAILKTPKGEFNILSIIRNTGASYTGI